MRKLLFLSIFFPIYSFANIITGYSSITNFSPSGNYQAVYDFDNNGQFDLLVRIKYLGSSNYTFVFKGMNGTKVETDGNYDLLGYNAGTPLGINTYQDSGYVKSLYFPEMVKKYVGLKFLINGNYVCAYFGVVASSYYQGFFDLYDYGYETDYLTCINTAAVGINEVKKTNNLFYITPNPTNGKIKLVFHNKQLSYKNIKIEIYNISGEKIYTNGIFEQQKIININLTDKSKGVYSLILYNEKETFTEKFILK